MSEAAILELPPDEALEAVPTPEVFDSMARSLDSMGNGYAELVRKSVELSLRGPQLVQDVWGLMCKFGWKGQTEQVHAIRSGFFHRIERRQTLITNTVQGIKGVPTFARALIPEPEKTVVSLMLAYDQLEAFKNELASRWKTLEDLEDLLAETYPLSNQQLAEIRKSLPPFHQKWYEEESTPA